MTAEAAFDPEALMAEAGVTAEPRGDGESLADRMIERLLDAEELVDRPPPSWLIDEVFPADSTTFLYGKPASGKSFTALDWATCVALGLPWQGRAVQQGFVLYVAAEGVAGLGIRIKAWKTAFGVAKVDNIKFFPGAINLLDPARRAALVEVIRRLSPALLVIDTMARSMAGGDENSAKDVGLVVDASAAFREARPGLAVVIVHHMDKAGSTYRGSSAVEGAAETMIECSDDDGTVTLDCKKQKDAAEFKPIKLRRVLVELGDGHTSCVLRAPSSENLTENLAESRRLLLGEFLTHFSQTGASRAQLKLVTKLPEATFYRALNDLVKVGALVNEGTDKQPFYKPGAES